MQGDADAEAAHQHRTRVWCHATVGVSCDASWHAQGMQRHAKGAPSPARGWELGAGEEVLAGLVGWLVGWAEGAGSAWRAASRTASIGPPPAWRVMSSQNSSKSTAREQV